MDTRIVNQNTLILLRQRCEKISAAMLLIADLFEAEHPLNNAFTKNAINLLDSAVPEKRKEEESLEKVSLVLQKLSSLLVSAHDARLVSTMNYDLLIGELEATIVLSESQARSREFVSSVENKTEADIQMLAIKLRALGSEVEEVQEQEEIQPRSARAQSSPQAKPRKQNTEPAKTEGEVSPLEEGPLYRAQRIMTIIRQNRGAATMNDIVLQIPGVSTKTLQRDLAGLIDTSQIARIGARRWAKYVISGSPQEEVLVLEEKAQQEQKKTPVSSFVSSTNNQDSPFLVKEKPSFGTEHFSSQY